MIYTIQIVGRVDVLLRAYKRFVDMYILICMYKCIIVVIELGFTLTKSIFSGTNVWTCFVCMHGGTAHTVVGCLRLLFGLFTSIKSENYLFYKILKIRASFGIYNNPFVCLCECEWVCIDIMFSGRLFSSFSQFIFFFIGGFSFYFPKHIQKVNTCPYKWGFYSS